MVVNDIFHHRSSPAASLREEGNPQDWILDEAFPEPIKAPWTAANVGMCWRGSELLLPPKILLFPKVRNHVDFLPIEPAPVNCCSTL